MAKEQVTLDEVLLSNLLAIRGNKYKDNPECGAAKQIIRRFSAWTINTYPLLDAKHISRELLMEYLFQVAHDTRCSGKIQEYGFAELTGKILSDATGQTVSIYETAIMQPYTLICPSCGILAEFVDDKTLYGKDFGGKMFYWCPKCNARVGTHEGTPIPMGTMAGPLTLELRKKCHEAFDKKWKSGEMTRDEAYAWLAQVMQLSPESAHIAKFNGRQCNRLLWLLNQEKQAKTIVAMPVKAATVAMA